MPTNKKRQNGFYWVKINGKWTVGVFNEMWFLPGISSEFWDNELEYILETPIKKPLIINQEP